MSSAKNNRNKLRYIHLFAAGLLGTYIYSPWHSIIWFQTVIMYIVFPIIVLTGIWMWKGKAIHALWQRS